MMLICSRDLSLTLHKMIRELASKRLTSPSRTHLRVDAMLSKGMARKRESHSEGSKNVDALKPTSDEEDSEIEISGPFPLSLKPESTKIVQRTGLKHAVVQQPNAKPCVFSFMVALHPTKNISIHPFFRPHASSCGPRYFALRAASSAAASELRLELASLNAIASSQNAASGKLNSVNTFLTSSSVPDAQINQFPIYSYKHYKPLPTVVYTQHEQEANDLIAGLKAGYVFQQTYHNFSSVYDTENVILSPIAFDMEWCFYFVRRNAASNANAMIERRTAVVQVADSSGLILIIQICNMSRMSSAVILCSHF